MSTKHLFQVYSETHNPPIRVLPCCLDTAAILMLIVCNWRRPDRQGGGGTVRQAGSARGWGWWGSELNIKKGSFSSTVHWEFGRPILTPTYLEGKTEVKVDKLRQIEV